MCKISIKITLGVLIHIFYCNTVPCQNHMWKSQPLWNACLWED